MKARLFALLDRLPGGRALHRLLDKVRGWKVLIVAGALTFGETLVALGVPLPGSDDIPELLRRLLIALLSVAAFYYRLKATKEARHG